MVFVSAVVDLQLISGVRFRFQVGRIGLAANALSCGSTAKNTAGVSVGPFTERPSPVPAGFVSKCEPRKAVPL